jgi:hypothetical protein
MPAFPTQEHFERFVSERRYLLNVSPKTEQLYYAAWGKWCKYGQEPLAFVSGMRNDGITPEGCIHKFPL